MDHCSRHALGLDLRHVTGNTGAALASRPVMGVLFQGGGMRTIWRVGAMAIQANLIDGFSQLRIVAGTVRIVTRGTGDFMPVHDALHKIVTLHSILARGAVGKIVEVGLTECAVLQLPIVSQWLSYRVTNRPVVVFALNRIVQRPSLGVALDTGVGVCLRIHPARVENI